MAYSKICPMDNVVFICHRVSAVFCSKKCRNKARSLPEAMRIALIQRSNQYILKANNFVAEAPTIDGRIVKVGKEVTDQDLRDLEIVAINKKKEQEEKSRLLSEQSTSGFSELDEHDTSEDVMDLSDLLDKKEKKEEQT